MKFISRFLLLCLVHCNSGFNPHPVSAPSVALICQPGREVWCEWGNPECPAVELAVKQINEVVPGLMVYKGEIPRETLIARINDGVHVITGVLRVIGVPEDKYSELPIAQTELKLSNWDPGVCLPTVPIALIWPHDGLNVAEWNQVVLHELLHSLGAGHAPPMSPFSTVMRPAISIERRTGLSIADKNWLRAVYGE